LNYALLLSAFIVAACGLIYELVAGAVSSYILGDSLTQFSTVIGTYLFAMGLGSYASKYIDTFVVERFVEIELIIALIGGFSAAILFLSFAHSAVPFRVMLYGLVLAIGFLVGLEIPLIMRILKKNLAFKDLVSNVLTFDYLGALAVSILFPLVFAPKLGMIRTALVFGLLNAAIAAVTIYVLRYQITQLKLRVTYCVATLGLLLAGLIYAGSITQYAETTVYQDEIVWTKTSPFQKLVVTRWRDDWRLFINGNLQFSSRDEYRYHEALVHPAMSAHPSPKRVLVLGGGDGLAVREALKYNAVESITLVDLDPEMTDAFKTNAKLIELNVGALNHAKVKVVNQDAFKWIEDDTQFYDVVIVDFPDPSNYALGKLYSLAFYQMLERRVSEGGIITIQSTSPYYARQSFWCVVTTLEEAGFSTSPYHALVPSFGEWGFVIATKRPFKVPEKVNVPVQFLTPQTLQALFVFPPDMSRVPTDVNRLNNQVLVQYFEQEWRKTTRER
jgi:spermidine synthase